MAQETLLTNQQPRRFRSPSERQETHESHEGRANESVGQDAKITEGHDAQDAEAEIHDTAKSRKQFHSGYR